VAPDVVATVIPQVRLISMLIGRGADTSLTVGEASGEIEVTDSVSDRVVAAGVDRRVGQRSLRGAFSRWDDVEEAWNVWAEMLRVRLVEAGAGHAPVADK
jgi:pentatricopeptide repeat protein